nr:5'-nucleotidase [Photobacterium lipolyticum]
MFFDDQDVHLEHSSLIVPCGKVLYNTDSPLNKLKDRQSANGKVETSKK